MEQRIQVAKDERKEKKRGGLFGWLRNLGKGSFRGAAGGFGGLGGGLADAGFAGGLLATKAGLIGLIMIGATMAGGLGVLGYRVFGPGADASPRGGYQLFEAKPASTTTEAGAPKDGNSESLSLFAKGNASQAKEVPKAEASPAATDKTATEKSAVGSGQSINANVGGNKATSLKTDRKFGDMSKFGSAGGAGGGTSATSGNAALNQAHTAPGSSKGMAGKPAAASVGRSIARRLGGSNSLQQLGQVRRDQAAAPSSSSAGATYDGAKPAGVSAADAGTPGGAGTGDGNASRPNPTNGNETGDRFPPAPAADHTNVTPWQGAINTAMMCIVGAGALLFAASKMKKTDKADPSGSSKAIVMILTAIAAMLALMAIALGAMMAGGKYGQKFQGHMFELSGGLMLATAAMGFMPAPQDEKGFDPQMIMLVSGGAALAAAMAGYISKPMKVDSSFFPGGKPPDFHASYKSQTEDVLRRYLV